MAENPDDAPVDLTALRRAAAPVIAWYERFLAGDPMPLASLDIALGGLRGLPPLGGRLGKALALVATGGRQATTEETIAALELLRHHTGLRHVPRPPSAVAGAAKAPQRRWRRGAWTQDHLPGMEA
jgi:hypothetical protein